MENHQCLTIGINRYPFFPPLNYAIADAQAIYQFLCREVDIPSQKVLLMTDTATYPSRANFLKALSSPASPSRLWLFFSGYGVTFQGEDYLMPIDGNPKDIANTGIKARSLFTLLQQKAAQQTLVILDINRPTLGNHSVGRQTIKLAQQMGIALILAAQPEQFSYEVTGLGHGMLTSVLLEALRHYRHKITLSLLERYLQDRLPEYSALYWRPLQTPVVISPSLKASQELLFFSREQEIEKAKEKNDRDSLSFSVEKNQKKPTSILLLPKLPESSYFSPFSSVNVPPVIVTTTTQARATTPERTGDRGQRISQVGRETPPDVSLGTGQEEKTATTQARITDRGNAPDPSKKLDKTYLWGLIFFLSLLILPILIKLANLPGLSPQFPADSFDRAKAYLAPHQASLLNKAIGEARHFQPAHPLYREAQTYITRWSQGILDIAQGRAKIGDFQGAIAAARLVPPDTPSYQLAQESIQRWKSQTQKQ